MVCILGFQIKTKISGVVDQVDCLQNQNKWVESNQRTIYKMMRNVDKAKLDVNASGHSSKPDDKD